MERWILAVGLLAIVLLTTFPTGDSLDRTPLLCLLCGGRGLADGILNAVIFLPAGWAARRLLGRTPRVILAGLALSLAIELAQVTIPGRDPALGDVVFNTAGAAIGALLVGLSLPVPGFVAWVLSPLLVLLPLATAFVLQPGPPDSAWYGQWTAELEHLHPYSGRVLAARMGDAPVPPTLLQGAMRERLLAGAPVRVRAVAGQEPPAIAPVLSIYDAEQREVLLLGVDRDNVVFRYRTLAPSLRLDQPDLRLFGGMAGVRPGDEMDLAVDWGHGLCVARDARRACGLMPPAGRGWALLHFFDDLGPGGRAALDMAWIGAVALLLGLLWTSSLAAAAWSAALGLSLVVGDLVLGLPEPAPAPLAGLVLGSLAAKRLSRWLTRQPEEDSGPTMASTQRSMRA